MTTETVQSPLEAALLSIINNTTQAVGKGIDFLSTQIPDVIHQLLMWKAVESFIWFIIPVIFIVVVLVVCTKIDRQLPKEHLNKYLAYFPGAVLSTLLFTVTMFHLDWLQIMIAPKVWLIEYAAHLVKGN